mmetsp:Transcript_44783/g.136674  ORF Transcript_44783/g.136674 Transcript_44783/m.136674 type:complete len:1531 (-) Transcript_44783:24-4616(-)
MAKSSNEPDTAAVEEGARDGSNAEAVVDRMEDTGGAESAGDQHSSAVPGSTRGEGAGDGEIQPSLSSSTLPPGVCMVACTGESAGKDGIDPSAPSGSRAVAASSPVGIAEALAIAAGGAGVGVGLSLALKPAAAAASDDKLVVKKGLKKKKKKGAKKSGKAELKKPAAKHKKRGPGRPRKSASLPKATNTKSKKSKGGYALSIPRGEPGNKWEERWAAKFDELVAFKKLHGHVKVPWKYADNPPLGFWCSRMKIELRNFHSGGADIGSSQREKKKMGTKKKGQMQKVKKKDLKGVSFLTAERAAALENLGMISAGHYRDDEDDVGWSKRFEQLKEYRVRYGDCHVPPNYADDPKLPRWVRRQREALRKYIEEQEGCGKSESEEGDEAADENKKDTEESSQKKGPEDDAIKIKTTKGDGEPRSSSDSPPLTAERAVKLTELGILLPKARDGRRSEYASQPRPPTIRKKKATDGPNKFHAAWDARFEELKRYRAANADCCVSPGDDTWPGLGTWVYNQRNLYKRWRHGLKSSMTEDRAWRLEAIGFVVNQGALNVPPPTQSELAASVAAVAGEKSVRKRDADAEKEVAATTVAASATDLTADEQSKIEEIMEDAQRASTASIMVALTGQKGEGADSENAASAASTSAPNTPILAKSGSLKDTAATLTAQKIRFGRTDSSSRVKQNANWEAKMEQLRAFKEKHRHVNVPKQFDENRQLGYWIDRQRSALKQFLEGKDSRMTVKRAADLVKLGVQPFGFGEKRTPGPKPKGKGGKRKSAASASKNKRRSVSPDKAGGMRLPPPQQALADFIMGDTRGGGANVVPMGLRGMIKNEQQQAVSVCADRAAMDAVAQIVPAIADAAAAEVIGGQMMDADLPPPPLPPAQEEEGDEPLPSNAEGGNVSTDMEQVAPPTGEDEIPELPDEVKGKVKEDPEPSSPAKNVPPKKRTKGVNKAPASSKKEKASRQERDQQEQSQELRRQQIGQAALLHDLATPKQERAGAGAGATQDEKQQRPHQQVAIQEYMQQPPLPGGDMDMDQGSMQQGIAGPMHPMQQSGAYLHSHPPMCPPMPPPGGGNGTQQQSPPQGQPQGDREGGGPPPSIHPTAGDAGIIAMPTWDRYATGYTGDDDGGAGGGGGGGYAHPPPPPLPGQWGGGGGVQYPLHPHGHQHHHQHPHPAERATTKSDERWYVRLAELQLFQEEHGHTRVPRTSPLGNWVHHMRSECNRILDGKTSRLSRERAAVLEGMGIHERKPRKRKAEEEEDPNAGGGGGSGSGKKRKAGDDDRNRKASARQIAFLLKFAALREFKALHGHCHVPREYPENKELGNWYHRCRTEYKKLKEGRETRLTPQRAQALETLGINESRPKKGRPPKSLAEGKKKKEPKKYISARPKQDSNFEQRCQELRAFKEAHGHTRVPAKFSENQSLAFWVSRQRIDLQKFKEGKKNHMTADRVAILDAIGIHKKKPPKSQLHSFQWLKMQKKKKQQDEESEEEEEDDDDDNDDEEEEDKEKEEEKEAEVMNEKEAGKTMELTNSV